MANCSDRGSAQEELQSLLQVQGGICSPRGLVDQNGCLYAEEADPWVLVECFRPCRFVVLDLRVPEGYRGDLFSVYYSVASDPGFSERRAVRLETSGKVFLTQVLMFAEEVDSVRLDPTEREGDTGIASLRVCVTSEEKEVVPFLCGGGLSDAPRCLVVTHDLTKTGAPLLARRITEELTRQGVQAAALCVEQGRGELAADYWARGLPLLDIDILRVVTDEGASAPEELSDRAILSLFLAAGYDCAVLNTVVSAQHSASFKQAGMRVVSLIHETRETLVVHAMDDMPKKAAAGSDTLVFPARSVRDGFLELANDVPGSVCIRPQGVYLSDDCADDEAARVLLEGLGISRSSILVLGSGTPELRKGYDLFVAEAVLLRELMPQSDIHFIWTGQSQRDAMSHEYLDRLEMQVESSVITGRFHRLEFLNAPVYSSLLNRADVFWCTSRDDTFPSVVLEAMQRTVPVVAYAKTGGVDVMLAEDRGWLIDRFAFYAFAECTRALLLERNEEAEGRLVCAKKWVHDELKFNDYVEWLRVLTRQENVPAPEEPPVSLVEKLVAEPVSEDALAEEQMPLKKKKKLFFFK